MPVNEKFLAARAVERRQRDLIHCRSVAWLPLTRRGVVYAHTPLLPFTLRHRIELRLAGNAFFTPYPVLLGDVFLFLWRLHPEYCRPLFCRRALIARIETKRFKLLHLAIAFGSWRSAWVHRRLTRLVQRSDLSAVKTGIDRFLERVEQDAPGSSCDDTGRPSPAAPERHLADNSIEFLMSLYHLSHDEALDFPEALANQLYRDRLLSVPDGELAVFAPSDVLLSS